MNCPVASQLSDSVFHMDCAITRFGIVEETLVSNNQKQQESIGYKQQIMLLLPSGQHLGMSYRISQYGLLVKKLHKVINLQSESAGDLTGASLTSSKIQLAARVQLTGEGIALPNIAIDEDSPSKAYLDEDHYAIATVDV